MNFEPGKTYSTRSIGDHNCIISVTIAKRTAKTVTTTEGKTFRVSLYDGNEQIRPWGNYSMAPIIGADDKDLSRVIHPAIHEAAERDNREYDALLQTIGKAVTERSGNVVNLADYRKAS
jgi:signal recognition particle GTPase